MNCRASAVAFLTALFLFTASLPARSLTVTNTNDSGPGSLRQAILDAPSGDTITFAAGLAGQTVALTTVGDSTYGPSALLINKTLTVVGPTGSSGVTIARGSGAPEMRLLRVTGGASLTLRYVTLRDGIARGGNGASAEGGGGGGGGGLGGAVFNEGTLQVEYSTLTANSAVGGNGGNGGTGGASNGPGGSGGGPNGGAGSDGNFPGYGSTGGFGGGGGGGGGSIDIGYFDGNYAAPGGLGGGGGGGGARGTNGAGGGGSFAPITGARGGSDRGGGGGGLGLGGAILNKSGSVILLNSTISANTVQAGGGGVSQSGGGAGARGATAGGAILNYNGSVSAVNCTLAGNGGIYSVGENGGAVSVSLINTILDDIGYQVFGSNGTYTTSGNNNLIRNNSGFSGGVVSSADPLLGPLQNNGGPTATRALPLNSPAVDAGDDSGISALDQRGSPRQSRAHVDLGAYELQDLGPSASGQAVTTNQDIARVIPLSGADPDGDAVTCTVATNPAHGTLSAVSGNTVTYTPAPGYYGSDSFTFKAVDPYGATSSAATVSISVNGAPVSAGQSVQTNQDTAKTVVFGATDPEGDTFAFSIVSGPAHGTLGDISGSQVTYTPAAGYAGSDGFAFRATDSKGAVGNTATVSIAVNGAPVAFPQTVNVNQENTATSIYLSASDPEGNGLTYQIVSQPAHGSLSVVGGNQFKYANVPTYYGPDSFTFRVVDSLGAASNTATVSIVINGSPGAGNQTVSVKQASSRAITLIGTDPEGDTLTFSITTSPTHGTLSAINGDQVTYTPEVSYFGPDSFKFRVADSKGATSGDATVSINVVGAAGLNVTTAADVVDPNDGVISLREAVETANQLADPGGSVITFAPALSGQTITLTQIGDGTVGRSALVVRARLIIAGPTGNSGVTIVRGTAAPAMRLFYVKPGGDLTLRNLSFSNGLARGGNGGSGESAGGGGAGLGGMLFNDGTAQIVGCTLNGNVAQGGNSSTDINTNTNQGGSGGGLGNVADAGNGQDSQPGGNSTLPGGANGGGHGGVFLIEAGAGGFGGGGGGGGSAPGIADGRGGPGGFGGGGGGGSGERKGGGTAPFGGFGGGNGGTSDLGFDARGGGGGGGGLGGAIFNRGELTLTSSTLVGNTAQGGSGGIGNDGRGPGAPGKGFGGGVFNYNGTVTVVNSTLAGNTAAQGGGGIYNLGDGATATLVALNTIVAKTPGGATDFQAGAINGGASATSGSNNVIPSQVGFAGSIASSADPQLGALAANGGPTKTMALLGGSSALDAGDDAVLAAPYALATDQRGAGFSRKRSAHVDVGAFEVQADAFPTAGNPSATTAEDNAQTITLQGNSPDGSALTYEIVTPPAHGTLSVVNGNQVIYTPNPDFNGTDSFTYRVSTAAGAGSNIATVNITVTPVNDAPVAFGVGVRDDFNDNSLDPAKWGTVLPFSDSRVTEENGRLTLVSRGYLNSVREFKPATFTPVRVTGQVRFGTDYLQVLTRCDGVPLGSFYNEAQNGIEVLINPFGNYLSIIRRLDGTPTTLATTAMPLSFNASYRFEFSDDGSALSLTVLDEANPANTVTLTANDSTDFKVNRVVFHNREGGSSSTLDDLLILGGAATTRDTAVSSTLIGTDVDGDALIYVIVNSPAHGSVTLNGSTFTYTPAAGYVGEDSFTFKVNDGALDSNVAVANIIISEAPSLVVTTLNDVSSNFDGETSLREAIAYASTLPGNPAITFQAGLTGTCTLGGTLNIAHDMTITGPGANVLTVSGNNAVRVFNVTSGTVVIADLTIANGRVDGGYSGTNEYDTPNGGPALGGGIYNNATLSLLNCHLTGNQARGGAGASSNGYAGDGGPGLGGGIYNLGTLSLTGCTLSNNLAAGGAGGSSTAIIYSGRPGAGNGNSGQGGGIYNFAALTVVNCTVSGNTATAGSGGGGNPPGGNGSAYGGGLFNAGTLNLRHATLSGNASLAAGGIYTSGALTIAHTILNAGALGANLTVGGGTVTDMGYNLSSDNTASALNQAGDQNGTDPKLDTLKNNGGSTPTHALLPGSPAFDAGNPGFAPPPATDQRGSGFVRVNGRRVDIGAFEVQANRAPTVTAQNVTTYAGTARTIGLTGSDPENNTLSFRITSLPAHGKLYDGDNTVTLITQASVASPYVLTATGSGRDQVRYVPEMGYVGSDAFTFQANDGTLDSGPATVSITVVETPSLVVTTGSDTMANDGATSLREAIAYASTLSGSPTITLGNGLSGGSITLTSELAITHDMTINGPANGGVMVSGGNTTRVFRITNATVALANLRIANGKADNGGGVQVASANVTLNRCVLEANVASIRGGALYCDGTLTLTECTISGNKAEPYGAYGGGLFVNTGTVGIDRCTFGGNTATEGAAIINYATLGVTNSTLSGNSAYGGAGGGIYNGPSGLLTINSCTIANNTGTNTGAGIFNYLQGSTTLGNSIVARNTVQNGATQNDVAGNLVSADYNLFGVAPTGGTVSGPTTNNLVSADVRLDTLKNNGGPTQTLALLPGSPAYEAGNNAVAATLTTDGRGAGFARKSGARVDIGAFESQVPLDRVPVATVALTPANPKTNDLLTATATKSDPDNDPVTLTFVWKRNGTVVRTLANSTSLSDTLDLSASSAGDKGDVIKVEVTPNDGALDGTVATVQVTVGDSTPLAGRSGYGLRFDGVDDYVRLPDDLFPYPTSGNRNSPMSFEAFFKTTAGGVILGQQSGAPFDDNSSGWVPAVYVGTDGRLRTVMFQHYASPATLDSGAPVNDGAWHHIAVTYDGTTERFYLDGALAGSRNVVQVGYSDHYKYQLGVGRTTYWPADNGTWYPFNGSLDEVRVWNRARTAAEIAASWNRALGGGEAGLLAYYRFDEGAGNTVVDRSGHGQNATLVNGPTWQFTALLSGDFLNGEWTSTLRNTSVNGSLAGVTPDNVALVFNKTDNPAHGVAVVNTDGTFSYTPDAGFVGSDAFGFSATANGLDSNGATVTIAVNAPPNAPPIAGADTISRYPNASVSVLESALLANDTDAEGNTPLTIVSVGSSTSGQAIITRANGYVFYDPTPGFTGTDTFTYTVADSLGATAVGTVTVNINGSQPPTNSPTIVREPATGGGSTQARVGFTGVPGRTYQLQFTDSLVPGSVNWQTLGARTADAQGRFEIVDPPPLPPQRFYRAVYP